ncbi:MAG: CIA30 family protein [Chromatiales bacterium]|mgnify:FL=1|jgi:NADH dehydrogenase [ubiquinone] 1 alpha subcomplex assembly factor 1|nr:CIA30 family protein [Chromatiales bacterium]
MRLHSNVAPVSLSLALGLTLLSLPGSLLYASDTVTSDHSDSTGVLMITDFTADTTDLDWYVQNDNVMGGRSKGGFNIEPGVLIFAGSTNTNGGGFSSIRTRPFKADLSSYKGMRLRVKGDGRRYTWQLQTNERYRRFRVSYWADFETTDGEWITVNIPFADFFPQVRGFKLPGPELDTTDIRELGLYIYDKKDGAFELRLDSIEAY